ncbi:MAG: DUF3347 domain-containing protein, partial [Planctomycetes bacterium]|nr:DUF3347 domain-containing protein [Planctomycetota bacterium]
ALGAVLAAYLEVERALATDDAETALGAARRLGEAVADPASVTGLPADLVAAARTLDAAEGLQPLRAALAPFSEALHATLGGGGAGHGPALVWVRCPMAFEGRGASWLQAEGEVENPYLGAAMLRCGEVLERIPPGGDE